MMNDSHFDRDHFEAVLADFVEDDPLACQGILSIARLVFTTEVPTLAVTLRDDPPLLLVNPEFIAEHVKTEDDILPEFEWSADRFKPGGRANVYLDVSGSMNEELNLLTGLLWKLRSWIRSPFNAFSNGVYPARIVDGKLKTDTTGGTCFNDVLQHIVEQRPGKSLIITDGYIEQPDCRLLNQLRSLGEEIHVLVSANGSRKIFERRSIPCTPLPRISPAFTP